METIKNFVRKLLWLIVGAIIGAIAIYYKLSKAHEIEITNIVNSTISKVEVKQNYIEKTAYESLKAQLGLSEKDLTTQLTNSKAEIGFLKEELHYIKNECEKIDDIVSPSVHFIEDYVSFDIENVYQEGEYIVMDIRLTNQGEDRNYGLKNRMTAIETSDGNEYNLISTLKGGLQTGRNVVMSRLGNNEEVLYTLKFGGVPSQNTYDKVTFRSQTTEGTSILEDVSLTK